MKSISIIIPIYNEEESIPHLISSIENAISSQKIKYEIIFVNDGSSDASDGLLDKAAAKNKNIKVIHFAKNYGQTSAMMAGIDHASGDILIPMDGDLQNDPTDIPNLLAKLDEGYDVCSGWRKKRKDASLNRRLPSIIANKMISWISGVHLHDYGCTLKAYKKEIIKDVRLYGEMHRFIPIYASWMGARVTELEVKHHARKFGKSKYGIERTVKVVLDLIFVKFMASFGQKPIYFFGGFGFLAFFTGLLVFIWMLYLKLAEGLVFTATPLPSVTVLLFTTGFQAIFVGILAEMLMRTYYESQNKTVYRVRETKNLK